MSNKNPVKFLLVFFSILIFQYQSAYGKNEVIIVGNHAPPFRIIEGKEFTGIYFDIARELFTRMKMKIVIKNQPFKRSLSSMKYGSADIMMGPNKTTERETYMTYVELVKLSRANKAFYVLPDSLPISRYEDLMGKKIGVHRGKVYFNKFDNDISLKKHVLNSYGDCIRLLLLKGLDVVIMPELEGDYLIKKSKKNLKKSPYIVEGRESYLTISNKSPLINSQKKIVEVFLQMKRDGTLNRISNKYKSFSY